jgi:hypothetical protein
MRRFRLPAALLGALVLALTLSLSAWGERLPSFGNPPLGKPPFQEIPGRLAIRGTAVGLYPGLQGRLHVTVRNPNPFAVRVLSLRVAVGSPGRGCPARAIRPGRLPRPFRVRGRGVARVSLPIRMSADAPLACSSRRFPLSFRARAVRP